MNADEPRPTRVARAPSALSEAAERQCAFCGERAQHLHHLTGRDPDRRYLDPLLVAALCRKHHTLVHADLRAQLIDTPPAARHWYPQSSLRYTLARLGAYFGRLAAYSDDPMLGPLAVTLQDRTLSIPDTSSIIDLLG